MRNVGKVFHAPGAALGKQALQVLKEVSLSLKSGEMCALVGESGSGKSTLAQILMGLVPPTSGEVLLDGIPIGRLTPKQRFSRMQMVLQDGKSSLDPRLSAYDAIAEPIRNLKKLPRSEEKAKIASLMQTMELDDALLHRKPHELSGGQQKRVCIARALAAEPEILIFDEAVSGLDVLVRKDILDLLKQIQRERNTSTLFITHDMDVALYLASRILVMKSGKIVEEVEYRGDTAVFQHPYSKLLLNAMLPRSSRKEHDIPTARC